MGSKRLIIALAALIAAIGAWYWGSPIYALHQLREAAVEGDAEALRDRIDFPSVRESLKSEMRARVTDNLASSDADGFTALGSVIALGLANGVVDSVVTPDGMATLIKLGKMRNGARTSAAETAEPVKWNIQREGFDRFRILPETDNGADATALVFHRDGLGWKLAEIELPEASGS